MTSLVVGSHAGDGATQRSQPCIDSRISGAKTLKFVCLLLAAPRALPRMHEQHPDVPIYTAAVDERLDAHDYIIPGPGRRGGPTIWHEIENSVLLAACVRGVA